MVVSMLCLFIKLGYDYLQDIYGVDFTRGRSSIRKPTLSVSITIPTSILLIIAISTFLPSLSCAVCCKQCSKYNEI